VSLLPLRCISPELEAKLDVRVFISNAEGVEYETHLADQGSENNCTTIWPHTKYYFYK